MEDIHGKTHGRIAPALAVAPDIRTPFTRPGISSHGVSSKPYLQPPMN